MFSNFTYAKRIKATELTTCTKLALSSEQVQKPILIVEIDVDRPAQDLKFIASTNNIMPVLVKRVFEPDASTGLREKFVLAAKACEKYGFKTIALSIDDDGYFQGSLSPLTNGDVDFKARLGNILEVFELIGSEIKATFGVALCVEELAPGGLDPTDGINVATAIVGAGAKFIISSGGTNSFPALKFRRKTKLKEGRADSWLSPEAWLSSSMWLKSVVNVPIFAQGPVENESRAAYLAKRLGFSGIVAN